MPATGNAEGPFQNLDKGLHHLFTASDGATAEVSTGFGIDHGGHVFLCHQVSEKLLTAFHLLPEEMRTCG